ncbi:spore protease YyaC [Bacillus mexicanus]|uniref:spore protease YyaC n=1 Tax=Bacillus mexicanus TaxID=2834415 RepID=UPI003D1DACF5
MEVYYGERYHNIKGVVSDYYQDDISEKVTFQRKVNCLGSEKAAIHRKVNCLESDIKSSITEIFPDHLSKDDIVFACIGTDRATGDVLGPMVGTKLMENGFNVIGTIEHPLHGNNLQERMEEEAEEGKVIVAIDATLGRSVGKAIIANRGLEPGDGVGRDLGKIGDFSIKGVVNVSWDDIKINYGVLHTTRLFEVMNMADEISKGLVSHFSDKMAKKHTA